MWFVGLILIGYGYLMLFHTDLMWDWRENSARWQGVSTERTEEWDAFTAVVGVIALLIGINLVLVAVL